MLRYCRECDKEFDFPVSDFTGCRELICPECGGVIDRNSRRPVDNSGTEKTETFIGNIAGALIRTAYVFYLCLAVIGIAAFFLKFYKVLYISAGVTIAVYILQLVTRTASFDGGMIFVPAGAAVGYYFGGFPGMCLGVHIVFFTRHILRDILFRLIFKLAGIFNR